MLVTDGLFAAYRGDKVADVTYRVISIDEDGYVTKIDESVYGNDDAAKLDSYITKNSYTTIPAFYIYDVEEKDIVIYLVESDAIATISTEKTADFTNDVWTTTDLNDTIDATIKGQIVYEEVKVDGVVTAWNILGVKYFFDAEDLSAKGVHAKLVAEGLSFGLKGDHAAEAYKVIYAVRNNTTAGLVIEGTTVAETVWGTIVDSVYDDECTDCDLVDGIYVKFNKPVKVAVTAGTKEGTVEFAKMAISVQILDAAEEVTLFYNCVENAFNADQTGAIYTSTKTIFEQDAYAAATATVALGEIVEDLLD